MTDKRYYKSCKITKRFFDNHAIYKTILNSMAVTNKLNIQRRPLEFCSHGTVLLKHNL